MWIRRGSDSRACRWCMRSAVAPAGEDRLPDAPGPVADRCTRSATAGALSPRADLRNEQNCPGSPRAYQEDARPLFCENRDPGGSCQGPARNSKSSNWNVSTEKPAEKRNSLAVLTVIPCSPAFDEHIWWLKIPNQPSRFSRSGETTLVARLGIRACQHVLCAAGLDYLGEQKWAEFLRYNLAHISEKWLYKPRNFFSHNLSFLQNKPFS